MPTDPSPNTIALPQVDRLPLTALLESILFVAGEPVPIGDLARTTGRSAAAVGAALDELGEGYGYQQRGLRLQRLGATVQLVTAPEATAVVERFLAIPRPSRLSAAALETLSVVAYRGPITRAGIEALRGVESGSVVGTLLARGLVEEVGHADTLGHPALLAVTHEFLRYFGLRATDQLPGVASS